MNRLEDIVFGRSFDEISCRPADAEGRQGRKGHVLLDECFHRRFSLTLWPVRYLRAILPALIAFLSIAHAQTQTIRQPAPVMSSAGADWLTRPERIQEEDPDRMLASLEVKKGAVVADIGAGVGYHVWRLSDLVGPSGKVIGEDIQEGMIRLMKKNIDDRKLKNVEIVLGTPMD